jgi:cholesterol oxidase
VPIEKDFDAVVIGSGFGGSIVALRLAEAGRSVLVLERGQPHAPGSFPRTPRGMRTNFWAPAEDRYGMFDVWSFDALDVVLCSGLGGGSLIYANVMLRKDESTFVREKLKSGGYEKWPVTLENLEPHYERVEKDFDRPEPYPYDKGKPYDTTPKTGAMLAAGQQLGLKCEQPNLAVRFAADRSHPVPGQPIPDGEDNLHGVPRSTCRLCGECDIGCNIGAKSTLDLTCLTRARKQKPPAVPAVIRTCCEAKTIVPAQGGGYDVGYIQHLAARAGHPKSLLDGSDRVSVKVHARDVVLAAGAIGSPRLLLENRASLRRLSPALGARLSANGDYFAWIRDCRTAEGKPRYLDPSRGTVITSSIHVDEARSRSGRGYYLQDAGAPAFADWLWQGLELPRDASRVAGQLVARLVDRARGRRDAHASGLLASLFGDAEASAAMMPVLAMGRDVPNGQLRIADGGLQLDWSPQPSSEYYQAVRQSLEELARALGGRLVRTPLDRLRRAITVHPVGGCAMAADPQRGVVDKWGRVHGHPGLWVADGSVMPGPVGPNPSLTIAAMADRFAGKMTR